MRRTEARRLTLVTGLNPLSWIAKKISYTGRTKCEQKNNHAFPPHFVIALHHVLGHMSINTTAILLQEEQEVVFALAETIAFHCPDRNQPPNESLLQHWSQELEEGNYNHAKLIMMEAIRIWREDQDTIVPVLSHSKPATTFSLLDFSGLSNRVFLHDIKEATEKLAILQQVDHVDDICMDWDYIQTLLMDGLASENKSRHYVDICTKWFDQADGIMRLNITELVANAAINNIQANEVRFVLLQAWRFMWIQLLETSIDQRRTNNIGTQVLMLWKSNDSIAYYLAVMDITSAWFHTWIQQQSSLQVKALILNHGILSVLFQRCDTSQRCALKTQSMTMLNIVLLHTRLAQFPWDNDIPQIDRLVSIMLDINSPLGDCSDVATQAMETILWGAYQHKALYQPVLEQLVRIRLSADLLGLLQQMHNSVDPVSAFAIELGQIINKANKMSRDEC